MHIRYLQWHDERCWSDGYNAVAHRHRCVAALDLNRLVTTTHNSKNANTYSLKVGATAKSSTCRPRTIVPVQTPQPSMQQRIVHPDHLHIALEQRVVRDIEPNEGGVKADISFGNVLSKEVRLMTRL